MDSISLTSSPVRREARRSRRCTPRLARNGDVTPTSPRPASLKTPTSMKADTVPEPDEGDRSIDSENRYKFGSSVTPADAAEAWMQCAEVLKEHDEDTVKAWKEEIDTLLVFAGLFSAVLTSFNVQAYPLLQPTQADPAVLILAQISAQLGSFTGNGGYINSTQPSLSASAAISATSQVPTYAVRLNILLFSSLVCSLAAASIAILIKQWLNQYNNGLSSASRETARLRQFRYKGLVKWKVIDFITVLPVLLQIALALFFVGLLELLWSLHRTVAAVTTVLMSILLVLFIITLVLPTFIKDCSYKSVQAWGLFIIVNGVKSSLQPLFLAIHNFLESKLDKTTLPSLQGWFQRCSQARIYFDWRERERPLVQVLGQELDQSLIKAAATFTDDSFLEHVIGTILKDIDIAASITVFYNIMKDRADYVLHGVPHWHPSAGSDISLSIVHVTIEMMTQVHDHNDLNHERELIHIFKSMANRSLINTTLDTQTLEHFKHLLYRLQDETYDMDTCCQIFNIIHQCLLSSNNAGSFGSQGLKTVASYMSFFRKHNDLSNFFSAICLVIHIGASDHFEQGAFEQAHKKIQYVLDVLQQVLEMPLITSSRSIDHMKRNLPRIIPAILSLAKRDNALVTGALVQSLDMAVSEIGMGYGLGVKAAHKALEDLWTLYGHQVESSGASLVPQLSVFGYLC
ncbi:hypothetical protein AcW1_005895 [Taiwanofungus camphoratus]|nr:hypothetical protein AcW1_005895 [Antrodia cinnamomea]